MRFLGTNLLLALMLASTSSTLNACCGSDMIPFPGVVRTAVPRNNHLVCTNEQNHLVVVDLAGCRSFDMGAVDGRRGTGDVANGQALFLSGDRLQVIELVSRKTVHEVEVGGQSVYDFGFAGKGQAFLHCGNSLTIVDLATSETLHTIELGEAPGRRSSASAWQKVGDLLFVVGGDSKLCVIDLTTGTLRERFHVESRAGIGALHVEGDMVYCLGSPFSWGATIDHLTCFNLKSKKSTLCELERIARRGSRLAGGPNGTAYLIDSRQIDHFDLFGKRSGTFTPVLGEGVQLHAVWNNQAVVGMKGLIVFQDINEKPVARK